MTFEAFPGHDQLATFADVRRSLEGAVVRDATGNMRPGVFFNHPGPLVTARSDMRVAIQDWRGVQDRGGAVFLGNEGQRVFPALSDAPWPAASAANRRIDLLWVSSLSDRLGDAENGVTWGIIQGTPSPTPVAPALPAALSDAIEFATVEIPAGATGMQSPGVIITPKYQYTAMAGGTVTVRNSVELAAYTPADGARVHNLTGRSDYVRSGGAWRASSGLIAEGTISAQSVIEIGGLTGADRYEVTLNLPTASQANDLNVQMMAGGAVNSAAVYDKQSLVSAANVTASSDSLAQTFWPSLVTAARTDKTVRLVLHGLNRAERTVGEATIQAWNASGNPYLATVSLRHRAATALDGIRFIVAGSAGTVTGRYEVRAM